MVRKIRKYTSEGWREDIDHLCCEEPLQLTLDGHPVATLMRSAGDDIDLVYGFLKTEGVVGHLSDIKRVDVEAGNNHALVFFADEVEVQYERFTRHLVSASSCGICGKACIEDIFRIFGKVDKQPVFSEELILRAPSLLRSKQSLFDKTGSLHAAGLLTKEGELLAVREDAGRHNAVDKVIGWAWRNGVQMDELLLQVSGRVSFDIIQKALAARIPAVSAISAPSALAVEFAEQSGMQLYGFVRNGSFNQYT